jgi:hypothetical protein
MQKSHRRCNRHYFWLFPFNHGSNLSAVTDPVTTSASFEFAEFFCTTQKDAPMCFIDMARRKLGAPTFVKILSHVG